MTPQEIKPTKEQEEMANKFLGDTDGRSFNSQSYRLSVLFAQREALLQEQVAREKERADKLHSELIIFQVARASQEKRAEVAEERAIRAETIILALKNRPDINPGYEIACREFGIDLANANGTIAGLAEALEKATDFIQSCPDSFRPRIACDVLADCSTALKSAAPLLAKSRAVERVVEAVMTAYPENPTQDELSHSVMSARHGNLITSIHEYRTALAAIKAKKNTEGA